MSPVDPQLDAEFLAAQLDPEFGSVEPTVVAESPQGLVYSDGTVEELPATCLLADFFQAIFGCK